MKSKTKKPETNPMLTDAILEAVGNQLRDLAPPEAMETYKRLRSSGHSDKEARRLIGMALATEIFNVLKYKQNYDVQRYVGYLKKLPTPPWE
jgi:hypothetical protein